MEVKGVRVTTRGKLLLAAVAIVILVTAYGGIRAIAGHESEEDPTLSNAVVACDFIGISPQTTGEVKQLAVQQGQKVKKGDFLFQLDRKDTGSKLKHAAALLEIAKGELDKAAGGARIQEIAAAQTFVLQAKGERDSRVAERDSVKSTLEALDKTYGMLLAQLKEFKNPQNGKVDEDYAVKVVNLSYVNNEINDTQFTVKSQLVQQQFEFKSQLEAQLAALKGRLKSLNASVEASAAAVQNAQSRLELVSAGVSSKDMTILVNRVKAAQIAYDNAKQKVADTTVKALDDGTVAKIETHVGETAVPGKPVLYMADMSELYLYALVDESKLDKIKLGQTLDIHIEAVGGNALRGTISEIGTTTLEMVGYDPFGTTLNQADRDKIPVKIKFNHTGLKLIPGMHADIDIQ